MIRQIKLPVLRHIRVWIDELPDATYPETKVVQFELPARPGDHRAARAAVEIALHAVVRWRYALVGGSYIPAPTGVLVVTVASSADEGSPWIPVVPLFGHGCHVGLPKQYARIVERVLRSEGNGLTLGPGTLEIRWAAHSPMFSSEEVFGLATKMLASILRSSGAPPTDDEIASQLPVSSRGRR